VGANAGTDNRWQGYSHQELYDQLNSGPGAEAATPVVDTWAGMSQAFDELQHDIGAGVTASGASWEGVAGDAARGALGPLGDWAQQASTAADMMRISTELQGSLLAKARADMPAPVPVTAEQPNAAMTLLQHLIGEQTDHEIQEASANAAEQKAFQVMAQYESATFDNTATLGDFGQPPELTVDTSPIATTTRPGIRSTRSHTEPARGTMTPPSGSGTSSTRPKRGSSPVSTGSASDDDDETDDQPSVAPAVIGEQQP
jgi:hypothetical protein